MLPTFLVDCVTLDSSFEKHQYQSQNYIRINSAATLGEFAYEPATQGLVKPNQIQNTAIGNIYFDRPITEIAKQINAAELELTGITVGTGSLKILGNIKQFTITDLGFTNTSQYTINYKIMRNNAVIWDKDYTPQPLTLSKFDNAPYRFRTYIFRIIGSGYEKFINDNGVKQILETNK